MKLTYLRIMILAMLGILPGCAGMDIKTMQVFSRIRDILGSPYSRAPSVDEKKLLLDIVSRTEPLSELLKENIVAAKPDAATLYPARYIEDRDVHDMKSFYAQLNALLAEKLKADGIKIIPEGAPIPTGVQKLCYYRTIDSRVLDGLGKDKGNRYASIIIIYYRFVEGEDRHYLDEGYLYIMLDWTKAKEGVIIDIFKTGRFDSAIRSAYEGWDLAPAPSSPVVILDKMPPVLATR